MNLFLQTRALTPERREDHLTCFLAAALEIDDGFREAYELRVLSPLERAGTRPRIVRVETQAAYAEAACRPDLRLQLADGRVVLCEHKLEAPETLCELDTGEIRGQLQRYLELPVDAVAYFRPFIASPAPEILTHPRYLHPTSSPAAPHFLWRDLYEPLSHGTHVLSSWLLEGFRKLGFTPPLAHIGELWPERSEEVIRNQENFAKLWHSTVAEASTRWKVGRNRRCGLDLKPRSPLIVTRIGVLPVIQDGTILRVRVETTALRVGTVRQLLEAVVQDLTVAPDIVDSEASNGVCFVDLLTPLSEVLGGSVEPAEQEARLFQQVVPILTALSVDR
jgi:hypothetical protein